MKLSKQERDQLWNALEYTLGTISYAARSLGRATDQGEWVEIHKGRAVSSVALLEGAKRLLDNAEVTDE